MGLHPKDKGYLIRRSSKIGVPKQLSTSFVSLVLKWAQCSGLEWTVKRLKDVKTDFLRKKAGQSKTSSWVKSGKKNWFGGPIGSLESYSSKNEQCFARTIDLLQIYTNFLSTKVTPSQGRKFLAGVTAPVIPVTPETSEVISLGFKLSGIGYRKLPKPKPLLTSNPSSSKRGPVPFGIGPEDETLVDSLLYLESPGGLSHLLRFYHLYLPVLEGLEDETQWITRNYSMYSLGSSPRPSRFQPFLVGRIGLIQEAGFKLRAIANPGRIFQRVLEPLGKEIYRILKDLPWDCTFQQDKADQVVAKLKEHQMVYSVDLSGATDYFPLQIQYDLLKELLPGNRDYVDLFSEISRGLWKVPDSFPESVLCEFGLTSNISWNKGQPLGLYPSFGSFALTHGLLLLGLLGRPYNGEFYILGDDVLIADSELYQKYRAALDSLGCPVSESKTLASDSIAEFRSVLYTENGVIPQYKWRLTSDESFLDLLRSRPYLYSLLRPRQRKVVDAIKELPEFLGGLGWNPNGKTLESRVDPFMKLILKDYDPKDRIMGYTTKIERLTRNSKLSLLVGSYSTQSLRRLDLIRDFDQKSLAYVKSHLGDFLSPLYEILGRNLDLVLDGDIDLPIEGAVPSRFTTLGRWESIIQSILDSGPKTEIIISD